MTGFSCFSIDGDIRQGRIKTKLADILIFSIYFVLLSANGIQNTMKMSAMPRSQLLIFGNKIQFLTSTLIVPFYILASFIQKHKIWSILHHLHTFDENLKELEYSVNHRKHKIFFWIYLGSSVVCLTFSLYLVIASGFYSMILTSYIPVLYSFLQMGMMQLSIFSVYTRQHDFIKMFASVFLRNKNSIRYTYVKRKNMSHVMVFSKLHDNLNLAVTSFNKSFTLILFVGLLMYFSHTVYSIYGVITFNKALSSISFLSIISQFKVRFLLIFYTVHVLIIFAVSNEITRRV